MTFLPTVFWPMTCNVFQKKCISIYISLSPMPNNIRYLVQKRAHKPPRSFHALRTKDCSSILLSLLKNSSRHSPRPWVKSRSFPPRGGSLLWTSSMLLLNQILKLSMAGLLLPEQLAFGIEKLKAGFLVRLKIFSLLPFATSVMTTTLAPCGGFFFQPCVFVPF